MLSVMVERVSRESYGESAVKAFSREDWGTIARLAKNIEVHVEVHSKETKKLKKKIQMIKHVLAMYLTHPKGRAVLVKKEAFEKIEGFIKELERHNQREKHVLDEMIAFLSLLTSRLNEERKKPKALAASPKQEELDQMKKVVEDL